MSKKILYFSRLLLAWVIPPVVALALGCSSTPDNPSGSSAGLSGTDEQIFVGDTLEMNYDPNVIMKRAESFHEKASHAEAIVEYQHFLDLHQTHVLAPYAQYKLALSHFKMIKTIDRDPEPIQKAQKAFEELLDTFPGNPQEWEAREKIKECQDLLAEHHIFVGNFYLRKEAYLAAAHRFEIATTTYPESEKAAEAKYQLAKTYKVLGVPDWSRDWLVALVREHPNHALREDGLRMLTALQKEHPDLVVAQNTLQVKPNGHQTLPAPNKSLVSYPAVAKLPSPTPVNVGVNGSHPNSHVSISEPKECSMGTWCESAHHPQTNGTSPPPVSPPTKTCQPNVWC